MEIEISTSKEKIEYYFPSCPMVNTISLAMPDIITVTALVKGFGSGDWLINAINQTKSEMISEESKLIDEAIKELVCAKKFIKEKYPIRYKFAYIKTIMKNPIKTLIAKWLLRSK